MYERMVSSSVSRAMKTSIGQSTGVAERRRRRAAAGQITYLLMSGFG